MNGRVTIADVARAAGVSSQTVSRVLNERVDVSPDTRRRILEIIDQLGYRPSRIARSLATARTGTFGLVLPDVANPFFAEVVRGAEDVARAQDYSVFLVNTDEDPQRELAALHTLEAQHVDGIILASPRLQDDQLRSLIPQLPPLVLVNHQLAMVQQTSGYQLQAASGEPAAAGDEESLGRELESPDDRQQLAQVGAVLADDAAGIRAAVSHLWLRGHRCIGLLAGPSTSHSGHRRLQGYQEALTELGAVMEEDLVRRCAPTVAGGRDAALSLLADLPEITALLCYNDLVATGALKACQQLRRPVPAGVAIVGYDDSSLAALVEPPLTTLRVPARLLGQEAMRLLLTELASPGQAEGRRQLVLKPQLVVRGSAP